MIRRRDAQPSLWDRPPPPPPPPPNVAGVQVCACLDRGRGTGFTRDERGWWLCGGCRHPTAAWFAAVRPDRWTP